MLRTWLGFPDGPRNTPALFGVAETLPIHWSGDLDELADVELTIRNIQVGTGLVPGESRDSLGPAHSGVSEDLDALATFLETLKVPSSPFANDQASELAGKQMVRSDTGNERGSVISGRCSNGDILRDHVIGMDKIEIGAFRNPL